MTEFFQMGGYAAYVWSSYALALVVLVANIIAARQRERRAAREIAARSRRRPARSES